MAIESVGIVGYGNFGRLAVTLIPENLEVRVYDTRTVEPDSSRITVGSLAVVAASDIVLLAVPLRAYSEVLPQIASHLRPDALLIDVCSVKTMPEQLVVQHMPIHGNKLFTHPLFGPQSGSKGKDLVVTNSQGQRAEMILDYCERDLGLNLVRMSAEEHDRAMATQALTFFAARGLARTVAGLNPSVTVPSYQRLLDLAGFDALQSDDLFWTIQKGNPFAAEIRQELIQQLTAIDHAVEKKEWI